MDIYRPAQVKTLFMGTYPDQVGQAYPVYAMAKTFAGGGAGAITKWGWSLVQTTGYAYLVAYFKTVATNDEANYVSHKNLVYCVKMTCSGGDTTGTTCNKCVHWFEASACQSIASTWEVIDEDDCPKLGWGTQ